MSTSVPALEHLPGSPGESGAAARVAGWRERLAELDGAAQPDAARIDLLHELERLKSAAAAAQARVTAELDASLRAAAPAHKSAGEVSRTIGSHIALARQDSPARGNRHLGLALALVKEMPHTLAALAEGVISEWRATLIVQATATLSSADRRAVDAELTDHGLHGLGDRRIRDLARGIADRLDPTAAVRRNRRATADRRVGIRPAPDTMAHLSALLPVTDAVSAHTALKKHAEALRAKGDPRTTAQIMADTLVARLTGQQSHEGPGVEIQLVMHQDTLLRGDNASGYLHGYGPVPARLARDLVRKADTAWVRRLFTNPEAGTLVATDSRRRLFTGRLRDLITWRDQTCRTPWCDAPIRHIDHLRPWAAGGTTSTANGQGLCEACNLAKSPDWRTDVTHGRGNVIELRTSTGHTYRSKAPPQPGTRPVLEHYRRLRRRLDDTG